MTKLIERGETTFFGRNLLYGMMVLFFLAPLPKGAGAEEEKDLALELYYTANGLYNRQLYELAAQEYQQFLSAHPDHDKVGKARLGLALSTYGMRKYDEAAPMLEELSSSAKGGERTQLHVIWGQALLMLNQYPEAAKAFESGLPGSESVGRENLLAGLVEALYRHQDWADVVKWSSELTQLAPNGTHTWRASFQGAQAFYELDQFPQATRALKALAQVSGGSPQEQQIVFLLAESQRQSDDLDGAARSYARAHEIGGAFSADSLFRLGYIRFHQGRFDDAIGPLRQLLRDHDDYPSASQAAILVGRAYLEESRYGNAETIFRQLAEIQAMEAEAKLWHGKVLMRRERYGDVEDLLSTVVSKASGFKADLMYDYGSAMLAQDKFDQAAAVFISIADEFSSNTMAPEAVRLGALCLHRAGEYAASIVQCDRFLKLSDQKASDQVAFLRGENLYFLENLDAAIQAYRAFLTSYDQSEKVASARMRLGMIYHTQGKWEEAVTEFQLLDGATGALFAQARFLLGDAYFELDQWNQAIEALEAYASDDAAEINADTALFKAAQAHERMQDAVQAIGNLEKLVAKFPNSTHMAHALVEQGRLYYESKQFGDAQKALQRVIRRHADSTVRPQADYYLGWIAVSEEKPREAIQHFDRVSKAGADHPLAADSSLQRGILLVETKEYKEAKLALDEFAAKYPAEARLDQAWFYGGLASVGEGDWDEALNRFQVVVKQHPDSTFRERALYESAWAEKNAGRNGRAMQQYEILLANFPDTELGQSAAFELAELEFEAENFGAVRNRLTNLLPRVNDEALRARVIYRLAWAQLSEDRLLDAAQSFELMLSEAPPNHLVAMASFQAGEARLRLKEYAQAETHFARALSAGGNEEIVERTLLRLGETQGLVGHWPESLQSYGRLVSEFPDSSLLRRAQFGMGWSLENQEQYEDAVPHYRKVVQGGVRDETSARCQFQIGECLLSEKKFDEAIREFIQLEVNYGYPEWSSKALLEIGRALQKKGDAKGAKERYQEVLDKYSETAAAEVAKVFVGDLANAEN